MFAETVASFDITDVAVAIISALALVVAAFITAGWATKRTVKSAVTTNVTKGVEAAMSGQGDDQVVELQGIRSDLHMLHTAMTTSNNLAAQQWATMDRRVTLIEELNDQHHERLKKLEKTT